MGILSEILKGMVVLFIFAFSIPSIVDAKTRNSWIKLPCYIVIGLIAGAFMAFIKITPIILFFIWIYMNNNTLKTYFHPKFEEETGIKIKKKVYFTSSYMYIIISCVSAFVFQSKIVPGNDLSSPGIPLVNYMLGIKSDRDFFAAPNFINWKYLIINCTVSCLTSFCQLSQGAIFHSCIGSFIKIVASISAIALIIISFFIHGWQMGLTNIIFNMIILITSAGYFYNVVYKRYDFSQIHE